MTEVGFRCDNIGHTFVSRRRETHALREISFAARPGEFICLVGPSGCGKSTLLQILANLLTPTSGRVVWGHAGNGASPSTALVFQDHGVFPWMTVLENVVFGLEMRGVGRAEREARGREMLRDVGLEGFASSYPYELSVGMRQRVGIARAFITDVKLLLMDEPFGALDALTRRMMQDELLRLWRRHQHTLVFVTHDVDEAVALADRVIVLSGRPATVLEEFVLPADRDRGPASRKVPEVREAARAIWNLVVGEEKHAAEGGT